MGAVGHRSGPVVERLLAIVLLAAVLLLTAALFAGALGLASLPPWLPDHRQVVETLGLAPLGVVPAALLVALGALLVGMLVTWLLLTRAWPRGGGGSSFLLSSDGGGEVSVEAEGVRTLVLATLAGLGRLVDARVRLRFAGGAMRVRLHLLVAAGADLQPLAAEAQAAVKDAVERLVGVRVDDVSVRLSVAPPQRTARWLE